MLSPDARLADQITERGTAQWPARTLALLVAILSAALVAGCGGGGFEPMYAASAGGARLDDKLAQVRVTTIPGRVGQRIRNELVFETTGGGGVREQSYTLDIVIRERLTSTLVNVQGDSRGQIYHIDATFQLTDVRTQQVVLKGQSFARAAFQRFDAIYANVRARQDAEDRSARTIANDIRGRLAAFLSSST